jgi:hypothetical protein
MSFSVPAPSGYRRRAVSMSDYRMNLNQSLSSLKTGKGRSLSNGTANGYDTARREHGRDFTDGKEIMSFVGTDRSIQGISIANGRHE